MEAKIIQCNVELKMLLIAHGWIEKENRNSKLNLKKEFRYNGNKRAIIRFDYTNFVVYENSTDCSSIGGSQVTADELHLLFWYFNSSAADKQVISNGHFNLESALKYYQTITSLLAYAQEFGQYNSESKKFQRMLVNYSSIQVN